MIFLANAQANPWVYLVNYICPLNCAILFEILAAVLTSRQALYSDFASCLKPALPWLAIRPRILELCENRFVYPSSKEHKCDHGEIWIVWRMMVLGIFLLKKFQFSISELSILNFHLSNLQVSNVQIVKFIMFEFFNFQILICIFKFPNVQTVRYTDLPTFS